MTDDAALIWMRPAKTGTGRPAERSRAEVTAAAVAVADRGGAAAVSMRNVAAELGTGAASLYRYVAGRDDLLDLMIDATAAEYRLRPGTGDVIVDLVDLAEQAYRIMLAHPWLPELVVTRPTLGPNGIALLEHFLAILADHSVSSARALETFALMNANVATLARQAVSRSRERAQVDYLNRVAAAGGHPRIAELLSDSDTGPVDPDARRRELLGAILTGLLRRR